jgi:thiol-disulfide isomerase/thioredoxin
MDNAFIKAQHDLALPYDQYIANGKPEQQENWKKVYDQVRLTDEQSQLIRSFIRQMKVIVLSGMWCGDCVQQCPIFQKIAEANPAKINLKWADRDAQPELQDKLMINGGKRVPVVLFAAEDNTLAGWYGDRTLGRYRAIAQRQLGPSCPLPGAPVSADELALTIQEWIDQFERIHLMLRLSTRLRQKYND